MIRDGTTIAPEKKKRKKNKKKILHLSTNSITLYIEIGNTIQKIIKLDLEKILTRIKIHNKQ